MPEQTDNIQTIEPNVARGRSDPETWVHEYGDDLFRFALVRVRDRSSAEDLVQDTFVAALAAREQFHGDSSEKNWLLGVLKNKIADYFRKRARESSMTNLEFLKEEQTELLHENGPHKKCWIHRLGPKKWAAAETSLDREEFWGALDECCEKMPQNVAQVYVMREIDDYSTEEICEKLAISSNNLWVMLHRARMSLRRCLEIHWFSRESE
ncbi:MAG: sigma-70 family RNA polymerase sigma factor [Verrucomicrobiota bacterium]